MEHMSWTLCAALLCILVREISSRTRGPVIKTTTGFVRGTEKSLDGGPVYVYKNIPYGTACRFQPPVGTRPWGGILEADDETPRSCSQLDPVTREYTGTLDCLYLDMYVPKVTQCDRKMATMIWIHGGSFVTGSKDSYSPDLFCSEGVIVVVINYRLGAEGFICINGTTVTGNMGLKDQLLAMQWVHSNVANFGGDPDKITLFGQSAGSVSIDCHLLSRCSEGLFRNSIAQSGSILNVWGFSTKIEADLRAKELGVRLNCNAKNGQELLECLLNTDAKKIVETVQQMAVFLHCKKFLV